MSTVRLETDGQQERLRCDYAISGLEPTRKELLLRRVLTILGAEEARLCSLTDGRAIAELDALKASQDKQFVKQIESEPIMPSFLDIVKAGKYPHGAGEIR